LDGDCELPDCEVEGMLSEREGERGPEVLSGRRELEDWAAAGASNSMASRMRARGICRWILASCEMGGKGQLGPRRRAMREEAHHMTPRVHQSPAHEHKPPLPPSLPLALLHEVARQDDLVGIAESRSRRLGLPRRLGLLGRLVLHERKAGRRRLLKRRRPRLVESIVLLRARRHRSSWARRDA